MGDVKPCPSSSAHFDFRFWRKYMVRFDMPVQPVDALGWTDRKGLGAAAEKLGKLPFGAIPWLMSGNDLIAEVVGSSRQLRLRPISGLRPLRLDYIFQHHVNFMAKSSQ